MVYAARGRPGTRFMEIFSTSVQETNQTHSRKEAWGLTALLLRLLGGDGVDLDSGKEILARVGVADVLNSEVHALLDVSVSDNLLHEDTDGAGGNVVYDTSSAGRELARIEVLILNNERTRGSICGAYPFAGRHWP